MFTESTAGPAIAREYAIDVERRPLSELRKVLRRHWPMVVQARRKRENNRWYETSIYGIMDSSFLKPYHEEVCGMLIELRVATDRLERAQKAREKVVDDAS